VYDPAKYSSQTYHAVIQSLVEDNPDIMTNISTDISTQFNHWWAKYKLGMTSEKVRLAERVNHIIIPWQSSVLKMQPGAIDKCTAISGTKDKVDMIQVAKLLTFHMDSRFIPPKQIHAILQLAQFLPEGAKQLVTREAQQAESGGLWDVKLETSGNDIVFWVVQIKKILVRYTELVGVAINEQVGIHKIATWVMKATTVAEIQAEVRSIIDISLQIGSEKFHIDVLLGQIVRAMDEGTPQTIAFAEQVKAESELRKVILSVNGVAAREGSKMITDLMTAVENKYESGQRKLPLANDQYELQKRAKPRPSNAIQPSYGGGGNTPPTYAAAASIGASQ
jgi:hypothetical protein